LIAVAIPEGLPLAVTIALAFSMKAMMLDQCLVRVLASCETMGAATAICSDKTGTLTTNQMTVVQGLVMEEEFVIARYGLTTRNENVTLCTREGDGDSAVVSSLKSSSENIDRVCVALAFNSTARESIVNEMLQWTGNKTEIGLLKWTRTVGRDYSAIRKSVPADKIRQYPFSSSKKRMTTVIKSNSDPQLTVYMKGASEAILESCDRCMDENGVIVELTDAKRAHYESVILDIANQGNRTIGVAFGQLDQTEFPDDEPDLRGVFMGVLGIQDPIRSNVPDAVRKSEMAGLTIRMVTGDNINTAIAIGKKCNIYHDNGFDYAMTGQDFRAMLKDQRDDLIKLLPRLRILARSSPSDKYELVKLLQEEFGEVVGVTGDGTNDAPALKLADVGFAMNTGTDIAKGAADMVLLDDNFATVVTAIRWGRAVNDNIKKFLQFQLAINCAGVLLTLAGSLASTTSKEPFTPVQLLWLNLIMDTLAAIALATELPEDKSLERPPVFKQAPLVTNHMRVFIGLHGGFQVILIMLLVFLGNHWFHVVENPDVCDKDYPNVPELFANGTATGRMITSPITRACMTLCKNQGGTYKDDRTCQQGAVHSTLIFNTFIFCQIFNVINGRKIYGETNPLEGVTTRSMNMLRVFGLILAFQVIAVEVFLDFMSTTHMRWDYWLISVGLASFELIVGIIVRALPVKDHVPDFVERKRLRLEELREEHTKPAAGLHRKESSLRRSSISVKKHH